ncbi:MAG: Fic family protein [bacterium]
MSEAQDTSDLTEQARKIIQILSEQSGGLSAPEIAELLAKEGMPVSGRTLRRRLGELGNARQIESRGERRGRRYFPAIVSTDVDGVTPDGEEGYPPLSGASRAAIGKLRVPLTHRTHVTYDASFLDKYEPGTTWYLDAGVREQLAVLGATEDQDRPAGTFARQVHHRLLIDLSWSSSHLEGNTYSRLDTQRLLDFGEQAQGKDAEETQMIINHKAAIEMLVDDAERIAYDRYTILSLHGLLSENLLPNSADEGRLRMHPVGIGSSTYVPIAIPQKIEEYFDLILRKAQAIPDPFEQSFFVMVHIPYLQPFADANKRTSRLAASVSLIKQNLVPLSFSDVAPAAYRDATLAVYEFNDVSLLRDVFIWAYSRSSQQFKVVRESLGQPDPFRLRYRLALHDAVRDAITHGLAPTMAAMHAWAAANGIPEADQGQFAETAERLLLGLSASSAGRYRVTPGQFESWNRSAKGR